MTQRHPATLGTTGVSPGVPNLPKKANVHLLDTGGKQACCCHHALALWGLSSCRTNRATSHGQQRTTSLLHHPSYQLPVAASWEPCPPFTAVPKASMCSETASRAACPSHCDCTMGGKLTGTPKWVSVGVPAMQPSARTHNWGWVALTAGTCKVNAHPGAPLFQRP